ncbi:MAG: DUF1499 domain-containing protein [Bdellovibrionota bacterium]
MTTAEALTYLGVQPDGRLAPCPPARNGVGSSFPADKIHYRDPIPYEGSVDDAKARLKAILQTLPRLELVQEDGPYLHYESESLVFRLISDLEFLIDADRQLIDFRSASRYGYWDAGANARLIQKVKQFFASLAD